MIKIADIYVGTNESLLQQINIIWCRENSQHSISNLPNFNNTSIDNYKQEKFPTFMLAYGVYITCSLNWVHVGVIANTQC